jgi:hypothetical protein
MTVGDTFIILVTNKQTSSLQIRLTPLTPNDLKRRRAVRPLKIKIPSKNSRQTALRAGI